MKPNKFYSNIVWKEPKNHSDSGLKKIAVKVIRFTGFVWPKGPNL